MGPNAVNLDLSSKAVIGMVHVSALPGTPHASQGVREIVAQAREESRVLAEAGFDALIVENMHDRPYLLREVGPEIVAGMTAAVCAVREAVNLPVGVQVLAGANRAALAVALAAGASFIRAEGFVFAHVADEGLMATADAAELLRYRRALGADAIAIWADIKKKHSSHALTADVDLAETARAATFFGADGVIVTGTSTGAPARPEDVQAAAAAVSVPVAVGSGLTPENLATYWDLADAFIIGSYIKRDGLWSNALDERRLARLFEMVGALKSRSA